MARERGAVEQRIGDADGDRQVVAGEGRADDDRGPDGQDRLPDHQPGHHVRESHQPELRRALEEGVWSDGEPLLGAFTSGAPVQQPDRVRIRAWAEVADHFTIDDPRCVDALSPFYVWTPDYAEKCLGWRRHQPLHVLLLRTHRIPRPVTVKVRDEYTASHPWVELQRDLPFEGTPVLSDAEFERASEEIRAITSEAGQPVLA